MSLKHLSIADTAVSDLSPLRGMPLEKLSMARTKVRDVRPLLECPELREIESSTTITNIEVLRAKPKLEFLSPKWGNGRPAQTVEEFWLKFDYDQNPVDDSAKLAAIGYTGAPVEIVDLWTKGRKTEALVAYRSFLETSPSKELLTEVHKRFATADWTATWFPSGVVDPKSQLEAWRDLARGESALTAHVPMLFFSYRMDGPSRSGIHPDLTRQDFGSENFGMIANGKLELPPGKWRFALRSDDGCRLIVNGSIIIEQWIHGPPMTTADFVQENSTPLDVTVEYFQEDGWAGLKLWIEPIE